MNSENIEFYLDRIVNINEAILEKLSDVTYDLNAIKQELNWSHNSSYARIVFDGIHDISSKLDAIEREISNM